MQKVKKIDQRRSYNRKHKWVFFLNTVYIWYSEKCLGMHVRTRQCRLCCANSQSNKFILTQVHNAIKHLIKYCHYSLKDGK